MAGFRFQAAEIAPLGIAHLHSGQVEGLFEQRDGTEIDFYSRDSVTGRIAYNAKEAVGQPVAMLQSAGMEPKILPILEQGLRGERLTHFETIRRCKDGRRIEVWLTISPLKDSEGRAVGVSKIARDITARNRTRSELLMARDGAERVNRAKDEFLAALSHELRTPLNPILLVASEAASDRSVPPEFRAKFDLIRRSAEFEARLIDDMLDLTRITEGKLVLEKRALHGHAVLRGAIASISPEIGQKRIRVRERQVDVSINNR